MPLLVNYIRAMNETQNFIDELYSSRDEDEILEKIEFIRTLPPTPQREDVLDFLRSHTFERVRSLAEDLTHELKSESAKQSR